MQVGDDDRRAVNRASFGYRTDRPSVLHQDFRDLGVGDQRHPLLGAGGRHGLRDRAHAADGVAPGPPHAVHLAEHVVQQHIGGAGRIGAGVGADHAIEAQHGLDRIALEPAVQPVAGGLGEQGEKVATRRGREAAEPAREPRALEQLRRLPPASPPRTCWAEPGRPGPAPGRRWTPGELRIAGRRAASLAENFATSAAVRSPPVMRYWRSSIGRKFEARRCTSRRPWRASAISAITLGFSRLTA